MKHFIFVPLILIVFMFTTVPVLAQPISEFVTEIPPATNSQVSAATTYSETTAIVNINLAALSDLTMNLTVFGDTLEITHEETIVRSPTDYTYVGHTLGARSNVFIVVYGDYARLEIENVGSAYILEPASDTTHSIRKFNPLGFYDGYVVDLVDDPQSNSTPNPRWQTIIQNLPEMILNRSNYHNLVIDVMIVYTDRVKTLPPSNDIAIRLMSNAAINRLNTVFGHSNIPIELKINSFHNEPNYVETSDLNTNLTRLITKNDNYLDRIFTERDHKQSDIVIFAIKHSDAKCGKVSTLLPDASNAFAIVNYHCNGTIVGSNNDAYVLSRVIMHEIGHMFGARHEIREDSSTDPFSYGHAFHDGLTKSIMVVDCPNCRWDNLWSNPDIRFISSSNNFAGNAATADNARLVARTGPYIASLMGVQQGYTLKTDLRPLIEAPDDITMEATDNRTRVLLGRAVVFDRANDRARASDDAPSKFLLGQTTVTWSITARSGVTATDTQIVTITDTTPPTFRRTLRDVIVNAVHTASVDFTPPRARDIFPVTVTCNPGSGYDFPIGVTTVTCTARDSSNNIATTSFNVIVNRILDIVPPTITVPSDITVQATAILTPISPILIGSASVTDNGATQPILTNNAPTSFPIGVTVIRYTAVDGAGNTATSDQRITVHDTTSPVFSTRSSNITINTSSTSEIVTYVNPVATDIFDITISCNPPSQSTFTVGTTTVTCMATDANGNTASHTFDVTITFLDTIAPVLTTPSDMTVEATAIQTPVTLGAATATDNSNTVPTITNNAPTVYPIGVTIVEWTATDGAGNTVMTQQNITIQDTTSPVFVTVPSNITINTSGTSKIVTYVNPVATDIFDNTISCNPPSQSTFTVGTTTVTCMATDANGNTASHTFDVTVMLPDTIAPVLTTPSDMTVEATAIQTPVTLGAATATDNSNTVPTITNNAPTVYPIGVTIVEWTATDGAGNTVMTQQNITIQDTTSPVFASTPMNLHITSNTSSSNVTFDSPMATDIFDVSVVCAPLSQSTFAVGTTTVTCTATDQNTNTASVSFTVTVVQNSIKHQILAVQDNGNYVIFKDGMTVNTLRPNFIVLKDGSDTFSLQTRNSGGVVNNVSIEFVLGSTGYVDFTNYDYIDLAETLTAGTYTLLAGSTTLGQITLGGTVTHTQSEITIMAVSSNNKFVRFTDGITINNTDRIKFRGTIHGFDNISLMAQNSDGESTSIGRMNIFGNGLFAKSVSSLPNGTYTLFAEGINLGSITLNNMVSTSSGSSGASGYASGSASTNSTATTTPSSSASLDAPVRGAIGQ